MKVQRTRVSQIPPTIAASSILLFLALFYKYLKRFGSLIAFSPNASWCLTPEYGPPPSREHTRFSLFSANWGAGRHVFLPLAIALRTLDRQKWIQQWERSPAAGEPARLLRKQLPSTVCKVALKFGVDISDPISHISTPKMSQKKVKNVHMDVASQCQVPDSQGESCPSWSHAAYAPVQRHQETCHFFEIQNHHEHSRTTPMADGHSETLKLYKWSGQFRADLKRRSSPVLIWSKFFSKPFFGFPNTGLHTVQSV